MTVTPEGDRARKQLIKEKRDAKRERLKQLMVAKKSDGDEKSSSDDTKDSSVEGESTDAAITTPASPLTDVVHEGDAAAVSSEVPNVDTTQGPTTEAIEGSSDTNTALETDSSKPSDSDDSSNADKKSKVRKMGLDPHNGIFDQ